MLCLGFWRQLNKRVNQDKSLHEKFEEFLERFSLARDIRLKAPPVI